MGKVTLAQLLKERLAWVMGGVVFGFYWAHHFLYPVLLSALATPLIVPYIPLCLVVGLALIAYGFLSIIKAIKAKKARSPYEAAYFLTKQFLLMMALSLSVGLLMLVSDHFTASRMLYAGVWIPYLVLLSVACLGCFTYGVWRLWHGEPTPQAWRRVVRYLKMTLVWGAVFMLLAYLLSSDVAPQLIVLIGVSPFSWLILLVGSLSAALLMGCSAYLFHRYASNITLSINPFYLMFALQAALPIVVESSKVLVGLISTHLSGVAAMSLSVATPIGLTVLAVGLCYAVYHHVSSLPSLQPIRDSEQAADIKYILAEPDAVEKVEVDDLFDVTTPLEINFGVGSVNMKSP